MSVRGLGGTLIALSRSLMYPAGETQRSMRRLDLEKSYMNWNTDKHSDNLNSHYVIDIYSASPSKAQYLRTMSVNSTKPLVAFRTESEKRVLVLGMERIRVWEQGSDDEGGGVQHHADMFKFTWNSL